MQTTHYEPTYYNEPYSPSTTPAGAAGIIADLLPPIVVFIALVVVLNIVRKEF